MDKSFNVLHRILQTTGQRQKLLASNIANAETPGYKAKDIKFGSLLKSETNLLTTNSNHMKNMNGNSVSGQIVLENTSSWNDNNNVELNSEIAKMTENELTQSAAIKILNTKIKMYKSAINDGR